MKNVIKILMVFVLLISITDLNAQTPEGVNYQGTMRNASGGLMVNENITVIFEIRETLETGAAVYTETQMLTTNAYGGFAAIIGQGTVDAGDFSIINWAADVYFLNVNVNGNDFGTSQFQSVPYALNAKTAENLADPLWQRDGTNEVYTLDQVIIGTNSNNNELLSVNTANLTSGTIELVDFNVDNLTTGKDVLNIQVGVASAYDAQFIECRYDGTINFKVDVDGVATATEINSQNTGNANLVPIAYGNITASGIINSNGSTSNFIVTKTGTGIYEIEITGETINLTDYTFVVSSRANFGPIVSNWSIASNKLQVFSWASSSLVDNGFTFLVYKP